jgi:adenine phosphoribosyltransferase
MADLAASIRTIPDFPKQGIGFKDITTLLKDPEAFEQSVLELSAPFEKNKPDRIVGIEARGFIFGGAMAHHLGVGFVPVRKPGKLPAETVKESYALEYGEDAVEVHRDAVTEGMQILIVDDLLATGGTAAAAARLVTRLGGEIAGMAFLIELCFLNGRGKLGDIPIHVLIKVNEE